jgi:iron(III) transport system substrate-binding protein
VKFTPEHADLVPASARSKDGTWISQRLNLIVPAYRTDKVTNPPKAYKDLADPRFKDKMVMADPAFTSFSFLVVQNLSHSLGWDFFKKVATNGMMLVKGHAQVSQALLSGERSVALEADAGQLFKDIRQGAKIQLVIPSEGVFLINSPIAIPTGAPHPNAAKAFLAFNLSPEVQKLFTKDGTYSVRSDIAAPPTFPELKALNVIDIDYDAAERENKAVKDQFAEIFH